ncbi:uncharacterized protein BDFB_013627 [Asbolus verrucosus]|uniref:CHK kinase-like domain-containing protein n=1 Tax=Asbolus verrucosus TaxID=1661398 RepID=A0A482WD19_ASBVE|nr:uncharacterized protein BDFB_013627 [Asbolus verrucosus]
MSITLSEEKNELIRNIAECQGFKEYKIEVKTGSMKGDGYLGIINTIHVQDNNKPSKQLNLIMKSAMSGEKLRECAPVRKAYEREIYMYKTIFPEFKKFSEESGIRNNFVETAKCYGTLFADKEECLILENLREINFKLWDRMVAMNAEHVALVFTTYAKFHGTSLALKILQPEKHEEFSKNLKNIFYDENGKQSEQEKKFDESAKQIFSNGFRAISGNEKALAAFNNFVQNYQFFFKEQLIQIDKYSCILHGDCWCNNMMFRYMDPKNPSKPTEMCLLDWQIAKIGSPILDLSYFFYACSSKEVLYDLKKFLKIYHDNLSKTLKEAGLDPEEVFSYSELEAQWKIYSKFGLFMALFVVKIILSEVEEAPDLSELAKSGKSILESVVSSESVNAEKVDKRIADIIIFMTEHDYL